MLAFAAPCAVLVPAAVVHGFEFEPETSGSVLTVSDAYRHELGQRDRDLAEPFRAEVVALDDPSLEDAFADLEHELNWKAPAHSAAVEASLLSILVGVLRQMRLRRGDGSAPVGRNAELVARFPERIEHSCRSAAPIKAYASDLGVTEGRLRDACVKVSASTPMRLVHARVALEARRALLYSNMTVSEVAFHLGFSDPAYFSRFFSKVVGSSPRGFRARDQVAHDDD